ncbi:hypothetical protein ABPG72_001024 [Tetrahymena utriculariae]
MYNIYTQADADCLKNNQLSIEFQKNEDLIKIAQSISLLPQCSEKILLQLMEQTLLTKLTNQALKRKINYIDEQKQIQLTNIINQLEDQLLIDYNHQFDFRIFTQNLKIFVQSQNTNQVLICSECFMKKLKPLEIDILQKFELEQQENSNLYYGQNVNLFLGTKDSEKFNIIKQISNPQQIEIRNERILNGSNQRQLISCQNKAQTEKILQIQSKSELESYKLITQTILLKNIDGFTNKTSIFCSMPYFNELVGTEMEIAHKIGFEFIIKKCKSVRPFILYSYEKNQENGEEIFSLCNLLSKLVDNIPDKISCFSYVFTKFPKDQNIHQYLQNIKENNQFYKNQSYNKNVLSILEDMIKKTTKDVLRIDSEIDNPMIILEQLLKKNEIQNSYDIFTFSLSENAKTNILDQVKLHKESIKSAISRNDYKLIKYKLSQLTFLIKNQLQNFAQQSYSEAIELLISHATQNYTKITESIKNIVTNQMKLTNEDLLSYKSLIQQLQEIEDLRQDHLQNFHICATSVAQNMKNTFKNVQIDLNLEIINNQQAINKIQNLKFVSKEFPEIQQKITDLCQDLNIKIENLVQECLKVLKSNNFQQISLLLTEIKTYSEFYMNYLNEQYSLSKYESTLLHFKEHLEEVIRSKNQLLLKYILEEEDLENLAQTFDWIEQLQSIEELKKHIKISYILKLRKNLFSKVLNYFQKNGQKICEIISEYAQNCFRESEQLIEQMYKIQKMYDIENATSKIFETCLEKISQKLKLLKQNIINKLVQEQNQQNANFIQISYTLNQLKDAQWIDRYLKVKVYDNIVKEISENLRQYSLSIQYQIDQLNLNVKNLKDFKTASQLIQQLNKMTQLEYLDDKLLEIRICSQNQFEKSVVQNLNQIQELVNININNTSSRCEQLLEETFNCNSLQKFDFKLIEKYLAFIKFCLKGKYCFEKASQIKIDLTNQIQNYRNSLNQEIEKTILKIQTATVINTSEIHTHCQKLADFLQHLCNLKQYPKVFKLIKGQEIINKHKNSLNYFLFKLDIDDINPAFIDMEEVKFRIMMLKSLGLIKFFVGENKIFERSSELQKLIYEKHKKDIENIYSMIEKHKFNQVSYELSNNQFHESQNKQINNQINYEINKLLDHSYQQAITLSRKLEKELIVSIVDNLKKVQQVQFIFSKDNKYLTDDNLIEQRTQQDKIRQIYMDKINSFLQFTNASIFNYDFYEAENQIEHIKQINQILQIIGDHSKINEEIKQFQLNIQQSIDNLLEKYTTQEHSFLLYTPITIQKKISKALKINTKYVEIYQIFMQKVFEIIQKSIKDLKDNNTQDRQQRISRLILIYRNIPDDLKIKFEIELEELKNDFYFNKIFEHLYSKNLGSQQVNQDQNQLEQYSE